MELRVQRPVHRSTLHDKQELAVTCLVDESWFETEGSLVSPASAPLRVLTTLVAEGMWRNSPAKQENGQNSPRINANGIHVY